MGICNPHYPHVAEIMRTNVIKCKILQQNKVEVKWHTDVPKYDCFWAHRRSSRMLQSLIKPSNSITVVNHHYQFCGELDIFFVIKCLPLAGRNKNWSQKSGSSTEDVDQSAVVTYVEINSPGLQGVLDLSS